jgi:hypothetical protein
LLLDAIHVVRVVDCGAGGARGSDCSTRCSSSRFNPVPALVHARVAPEIFGRIATVGARVAQTHTALTERMVVVVEHSLALNRTCSYAHEVGSCI